MDADPDSTYHPDADPDFDIYLMRIRMQIRTFIWHGSDFSPWSGSTVDKLYGYETIWALFKGFEPLFGSQVACHLQIDADPVSDPADDFDADPDPDFYLKRIQVQIRIFIYSRFCPGLPVPGWYVESGAAPRHGHQVNSVVILPGHGRNVDNGLEVVCLHSGGQLARVLH